MLRSGPSGSRNSDYPNPLRADQMKPNFALNLSHEGIGILHRTKIGWMCVGNVSLDDPNLSDQLAVLRRTAAELASGGVTTKLIIPNSQILYTDVHAPGPGINAQIVQIRQGLEGKTPYEVDDLVFDWRSNGQSAQVAVVFRESLNEAESFAVQHGFNPVSFVAIPEFGTFEGEPFFGATNHSVSLLGRGEEVESDPDRMLILGSNKPQRRSEARPGQGNSDGHDDQIPSRLHQSEQPATLVPEQHPHSSERAPPSGQSAPSLVTARLPVDDSREMVRSPLRGDLGLTRMPVTSSRIAGPGVLRNQAGAAAQFTGEHESHPTTGSSSGRTPSQIAGYKKLGPALSLEGLEKERITFAFQRPSRRRRWPRVMVFLLALLLVIGLCVGLLLWISPGQIESNLNQFLRSWTLQRTADGNPAPILDSDAAVQLPFAEQVLEGSTELPSTQAVQTQTAVWTADPIPDLHDVSRSPPPDRILDPPPSIAESERTYLKTGIWPLDPIQPAGMDGDGRIEVIYVAAVDQVDSSTSAATVPRSGFLTVDAVSDFPHLGRSPPPYRAVGPPNNDAGSARIHFETDILPLDPIQPAGMVDDGRLGITHVAAVDRVDTPTSAATAPESSFLTANPKLLRAPTPSETEKYVSDWQVLLDNLPIGMSDTESDTSMNAKRQVAETDLASHDNPTGLWPATDRSSHPVAAQGDPLPFDRRQSQSPTADLSAKTAKVPSSEMKGGVSLELESGLAALTSPLPVPRPEGLGLAAKSRVSEETSNRATAKAQSEKAATAIPSSVSVASRATQRDAIDLGRINLVGTYGPTGQRQALVRLRSGRVVKDIKVGDRIDGGRVTAIGAGELHYVKNGRSITLRMPAG